MIELMPPPENIIPLYIIRFSLGTLSLKSS